ncbi:hypothetical protein CAL29_13545 [Bordetella genomosp. 10]|uniref:Nucleotidyl transferase AbiEii/AbiGii toxin family protein n=1 Tax=Bordetella genomosp. 10 TaxID=1416804 RepID=A0A261SAU6_9BORD|nr:nucleotidyl transferase AbiEii/AbiGii toxin family protein [Bordetella genomosp. 10]OZI34524.1 hypothetical protein CAL29_13545 [Bordetella genomosp. 10]
MSEFVLHLSDADRLEALQLGAQELGRPVNLLEKDLWVVWCLGALFESSFAPDLTFKGGTSLSKAHKLITRFSEDVDITFDIRKLIPEMTDKHGEIPPTQSQQRKWTDEVKARLPRWVAKEMAPLLEERLAAQGVSAAIEVDEEAPSNLRLHYPAVAQGPGYIKPAVLLEFGGRSTGEPHQPIEVRCDLESISDRLGGVSFPHARPLVMNVVRTFWEKATAAHVYCKQNRLRGERYARHWYDLAAIYQSMHCDQVLVDRVVAKRVADHKSMFFVEKDAAGIKINYHAAIAGALHIVPEGEGRQTLEADYAAMMGEGILPEDAPSFDGVMAVCATLQDEANTLVA